LRGETVKLDREPMLCFSRRDAHDVVVAGHKVMGSAQRRRRGAVLQHGSLLLHSSPWTSLHLGLEELGVLATNEQQLAAVPDRLALKVEASQLTDHERIYAEQLVRAGCINSSERKAQESADH